VSLTRAEFGKKAPKKTLLQPKTKSFKDFPEICLYGFFIIVVLGQIPPQVLYGGQVGLGTSVSGSNEPSIGLKVLKLLCLSFDFVLAAHKVVCVVHCRLGIT
jgi:hypothetical protein